MMFSTSPSPANRRYRPSLFRLIVLTYIVITAASCSTNQPVISDTSRPNTFDNSLIKKWSIDGKIAIRGQERSQSAFLNWQNDHEAFRIELYGPFGIGRTIIQSENSLVRLSSKEGEVTAKNASALFRKVTGMAMPIDRLEWWVRGLPSPGAKATIIETDPLGNASEFKQGDWLISYLRYSQVAGYTLPEKLKVSNSKYQVTMVINSWQLNSPENMNSAL